MSYKKKNVSSFRHLLIGVYVNAFSQYFRILEKVNSSVDISLSFSFLRHLQNYGPDEETIPGRENNRLETKRNREGVKREERWGEEEENLKS